jgi:outer membrane protein assembly factor BamB
MTIQLRNTLARVLVWSGLCLVVSETTAAEDWTGFRGPQGLGTAEASNLPVEWDGETNVVWKQNLPGLGSSSPIVLGSQVFLTCYSGYGESIEQPGDKSQLMRHVVCLDRDTGKIIWTKPFPGKSSESDYRPGNDSRHGYASSTIATDGEHLFVFFGISGVFGFDLKGNVLWNTDVGSGTHGWGSGTSPVLYQDLVIVNASIESTSLIALDKQSGKEVWRVPGIAKCWSSPMLVNVGEGQELVLNAPNKLMGFEPATGQELWHCEGIPDSYVCPSPISHEGVVYAIGGRKNTAIAVRAGGRGDVNDSHVLWKTGSGSNVSSPVYLNGFLYWFHESRGIVNCLNAKTGEQVYQERLEPRPDLVYSSVTAADGKLYAISQENGTYVLAARPEFELLAVNVFQDDRTRSNASIIVSNNQLLLRTDKALYCLGLPGSGKFAGLESGDFLPAEGGFRTWTDATGQHQVEAVFLSIEADRVALRKKDGSVILVPINRLSRADQGWIATRER